MALAAAGLPAMLLGWGVVAWVVLAVVLFLVGLPVWSLVVENRRAATDRLMTGLIWAAFGCAVMPLLWLVYVVSTGAEAINADFLSYSMRGVIGDEQGGVYHALIGTVFITLAATVVSVPIGILTAVYLVEYGGRSKLARWITFLVDVMTGIPSIVAGLFALALVVLILIVMLLNIVARIIGRIFAPKTGH
jgi:phosphate transport system permease protein